MSEKPSLFKRAIHSLLVLDRKKMPLQVEEFSIPCPALPKAFDGVRVAVVCDLHLPDQLIPISTLLEELKRQRPDAIFMPGDLTNSYTYFDAEGLRQMATALVEIAPCFATPGNHEWRLEREPLYREILTACGVHYLSDSAAYWHRNGATLQLWGAKLEEEETKHPHLPAPQDHPAILLAHRPEYFSLYLAAGWDLVVCGHAHGGHVRVGKWSLFSPDQGFFPKRTHGVYKDDNTRMVVSRGLGNSSLPWRLNNPPHLPVLILSAT